jgi:biopolymer transport protein ExbD/biopolymer transport protein TolR
MRETFNEINITPLTDIFLVLLIIMMVIAPLLDQQGISLTVPENVEASQIKNDKDPQILTIVVTQNDKYFIHNEEVSPDLLGTVLSKEIKNYPDGLLIETDGEATHGAIVKLMDKARYAGVKAISLDQI